MRIFPLLVLSCGGGASDPPDPIAPPTTEPQCPDTQVLINGLCVLDDFFAPGAEDGEECEECGGTPIGLPEGHCMALPLASYVQGGYKHGSAINAAGTYKHAGDDLRATPDTPVYAIMEGTVRTSIFLPARWVTQEDGTRVYKRNWGRLIEVDHVAPDGTSFISLYGHLKDGNAVAAGDTVTSGTVLGYVAPTGDGNGGWGAHLHFSIFTGTYPSSGVLRGHMTDLTGYEDPVPWILEHGRCATTECTAPDECGAPETRRVCRGAERWREEIVPTCTENMCGEELAEEAFIVTCNTVNGPRDSNFCSDARVMRTHDHQGCRDGDCYRETTQEIEDDCGAEGYDCYYNAADDAACCREDDWWAPVSVSFEADPVGAGGYPRLRLETRQRQHWPETRICHYLNLQLLIPSGAALTREIVGHDTEVVTVTQDGIACSQWAPHNANITASEEGELLLGRARVVIPPSCADEWDGGIYGMGCNPEPGACGVCYDFAGWSNQTRTCLFPTASTPPQNP